MNKQKLIEVRKDVNDDSPMGRLIDALLEDDTPVTHTPCSNCNYQGWKPYYKCTCPCHLVTKKS